MNNETTLERTKPICVVYLPENINIGQAKFPNWAVCRELMDRWSEEKPDYYWFVLPDFDAPKIEFKVFYEKDFTNTQYEELKSLITNAIEQQKNKNHE